MFLVQVAVLANLLSPLIKNIHFNRYRKIIQFTRTILEEHHPGLYWYTPKDSMDYYFHEGAAQLKDSMTEPEFRKVLTYVTSKINCGHTSVRSSKPYSKYLDTVRSKIFPLSMKIWSARILAMKTPWW